MTNVYGGVGESITYTTTADFSFNYSANSQFRLAFGGDAAVNIGFNSSFLRILVNGVETYERSFASLTDWENFFFAGPADIGTLRAGGLADVEIIYALTASSRSGFQFDYAFGTVPAAAVAETPLPATLPLFATGLGMLGFLSRRRKQKPVSA